MKILKYLIYARVSDFKYPVGKIAEKAICSKIAEKAICRSVFLTIMALHFEFRINKNSLLQTVFLAIRVLGVVHVILLFVFPGCQNTQLEHVFSAPKRSSQETVPWMLL